MAGYLIIGGSKESVEQTIERYAVPLSEIRTSGYGLVLSKESKQYTVSDLAPLHDFILEACPHERYCIIPDADTLTPVVQNKLLKMLEDSSVVFFLIAKSGTSFLPTVKSRLITLQLPEPCMYSFTHLFQGLNSRKELFTRMHLEKEKDPQHIFNTIEPTRFFMETEELFLRAIGYMEWKEACENEELLKSITSLWTTSESLSNVCNICESYAKKTDITKDDFFVFAAEITGV